MTEFSLQVGDLLFLHGELLLVYLPNRLALYGRWIARQSWLSISIIRVIFVALSITIIETYATLSKHSEFLIGENAWGNVVLAK